jgi:hypothetical protein
VSAPTPISIPHRPSHPEGWQKVSVADKFSFYTSPDLKRIKPVGDIDYFGPHGAYGRKSLEVNYTYVEKHINDELWRGKVSCEVGESNLAERPGYRSAEVRVGGSDAREISWQSEKPKFSFVRVCFPDMGDGTILMFGAIAEDNEAIAVARRVIASIEFP